MAQAAAGARLKYIVRQRQVGPYCAFRLLRCIFFRCRCGDSNGRYLSAVTERGFGRLLLGSVAKLQLEI